MKQIKFTLPKAVTKKGLQTVGGKYTFENGELVVNEDVARRIKKVLTTFHGCTLSQAESEPESDPEPAGGDDSASLSKAATKK